jgi:iron(III) transport system substrate-binding protein
MKLPIRRNRSRPHHAARPFLALCLGATVVLAACGDGGGSASADGEEVEVPEGYPDSYAEIIEGSREEGPLDIYSIMAEEDWAPVLDAFTERYPWVEVRTLDLGTTEVFERYYAESATSSTTADMIVSIAPDGWQRFMDRDEMMPYESPEVANLPEWGTTWSQDGLYLISADPFGIVYNEAALPEGTDPPQSLADIVNLVGADPKFYEGKVSTYAVDAQWGMFWAIEQHMGQAFWESMDQLAPSLRYETSGGGMGEKIASGEYVIGFYAPLSTIPRGSADFVKFAAMTDGQPISDRGIGITGKAESPNSAKLLIDFILSEEGQLQIPAMERVPYRDSVAEAVIAEGGIHYTSILEQVPEDQIVQMGPNEEILVEGEYDRILQEFADLGS